MQTQLEVHKSVGNSSQFNHLPLAIRKHNLVLSAIAMLSDQEISMMSREDLLDSLGMARSGLHRSEAKNIENMDVAELRRVLVIVREYFRKQMKRQSMIKGCSCEFN